MEKSEKKFFCPILEREIESIDCFDAALVYEEVSPLSELPEEMSFTDENQNRCLKCKHHPE